MAISTYRVFLMESADSSVYNKLLDIKSFPDLGGDPEMLETTTLSNNMQTFIAGILSMDALSFEANYDMETFKKLKAMEGQTKHFAVWFGGTGDGESLTPTGAHGKFKFDGQLSVYPTGGGVNEVIGMNVTIAPSTPIELDEEE